MIVHCLSHLEMCYISAFFVCDIVSLSVTMLFVIFVFSLIHPPLFSRAKVIMSAVIR